MSNANTPSTPFVHLHVHTHYSLLDGACRISDLVKRAKALGMDSIAITDHGCMFGVIEFFNECKKEGIKPILGMEAYMAPGDRRERQAVAGESAYHLLLLAQSLEGYKNLVKLSSTAYREGFYRKPRIDKEVLKEFNKGLIATSACLGGEIPSAFLKRDAKNAKKVAETYLEIFGPDRFFIEVQKQGIKEQDMVNPELADLAGRLGCGLVATNDVHFLNKEDHFAHDVLCCISMGRLVAEEGRLKYPEHLYLKSPQEMAEALKDFPEAIENTVRIAKTCDVSLDFSKRYAPVYRVPKEKLRPDFVAAFNAPPAELADRQAGVDAALATPTKADDELYLRQLCEDGLVWRYGSTEVAPEVRERLEKELKVIAGKNFCSYFLIVWDFCNFARDHGIPVGARGSGVGTMVGYLLGLCNVDPVKYGLLFERFMDPNRNEMPDIDIDICQDGRQRVIEYVRNKYGHVAQIITFGTLAAKAVCKDVGRVLGVPLAEVDKITKLIPTAPPGITLDKALDRVPDLQALYDSNPTVKRVIDIGKRLEGLARNAGCHAAGVIIADQPLDDIVPLYKDSDDNILTQFEGPIAEKCGLLKMDFLGLRTLTVLTRAVDLVKQIKGIDIDIEKLDLTDRKVLDLFCRGETKGIFQFESGGMQDLLMKMQPDRIEDLIAANALYRPGPMELIPIYCARKHGKEKVPSVHPIMDAILAETYGIMCIHEDVRVSMADGSERPIKQVRRGDRVHSLNQETSEFEIKECHGCGPTRFGDGLRITLENGFSVTLTEDHKVLTYDGMKEAKDLDPSADLVAIGRHLRQETASHTRIAPWLGSDIDVAYLLGYLIGDGCLMSSGIRAATGTEVNHRRLVERLRQRLPKLHLHEFFHLRSWYLDISCDELLNEPGHGNRKTKLHHLLDQLGMKVRAQQKRVPAIIFTAKAEVRAAFLAGLLDADGCTARGHKGTGACFLTSVSTTLLEDVRRLAQLEGIPVTIRPNRIQFWNLERLQELLQPHLLIRHFQGILPKGAAVGWLPRPALFAAVPAGESIRSFSRRTGIMAAGMRHNFPFIRSSTAAKAGIRLGDVRYFRIARVERVHDQQFYGMSVADNHNLVANGIVVKNCYQEQVMQVFNQLGAIELSAAYKLIKAISKKQADVIAKYQPEFLKGTMDKGVTKDKAEEIFDLILKFGGYGFNKCLLGSSSIIDARTGERTTVGSLFKDRRPFAIHSLGEDGRLVPRKVTDVVWNGQKPVFELRTAQGKKITATDNHPFRTLNGWRTLGELKPGDRIAAPRRLDVPTQQSWPRHELITLAGLISGLISEGNTCHPSCLYFFGNDTKLVQDFAASAQKFPVTVAHTYQRGDGRWEVCLSIGRDAESQARARLWNSARTSQGGGAVVAEPAKVTNRCGAFRWAEGLGIVGCKAPTKRVPNEIFALRDTDLELFLGRLWAGDGFIANADQFVPYYATPSQQLARDVQTLLLRLGIVSGVHSKVFKYRGGTRDGYTVHLLGEGSVETFAARIGPHCLGREAALKRLTDRLATTDRGRTSKDTVPPEVREWVDEERRAAGLTWRELEVRSDVCMKEFYGSGSANKQGFRRSTIAKLAQFFGSRRLQEVAASDVFWDRVVSIEPMGVQDTYDLTVETDHNFVADGLIVHNSHSTRYAIVAFQTAYMKTYHPVEYMAALLTYEMGSTDKMVEYIEECRRMQLADGTKGIKVLPPDVNVSDKDFTPVYVSPEEVNGDGNGNDSPKKKKPAKASAGKAKSGLPDKVGVIRFGLMAVRGVGEKAVEGIIAERKNKGEFPSLYDFTERVDLRMVTRGTIEALVKCGAFASTKAKRAQLLQILDGAVEAGQRSQHDKRAGQLNMFAMSAGPAASEAALAMPLPDVDELPDAELLKFEKELLGFYITSHPLTEHQVALEHFSTASTKEAQTCSEGVEVTIGGMISRVKKVVTKNGRSAGMQMAIITLEDLEGSIDGTLFAETFAEVNQKYPTAVANESIVFVRGKVDRKRETPSLLVNEVIPIAEAAARLTTAVAVKLDATRHNADAVSQLDGLLKKHKGNTEVFLQVTTPTRKVALRLDRDRWVKPTPELVGDLEMLLGNGSAQLCGLGTRRRKRAAEAQQPLFQNGEGAGEGQETEGGNADGNAGGGDENEGLIEPSDSGPAEDDEAMLVGPEAE